MRDSLPGKCDVQTSYKPSNICCERQVSLGNLSHVRVLLPAQFDRGGGWCNKCDVSQLPTVNSFQGKIDRK